MSLLETLEGLLNENVSESAAFVALLTSSTAIAVAIAVILFSSSPKKENQVEEPKKPDEIIGRVKKARQKVIKAKLEEDFGPEDEEKERKAEEEQMNRIYELLKTNEDKFGKTSMGDLKRQLALYK